MQTLGWIIIVIFIGIPAFFYAIKFGIGTLLGAGAVIDGINKGDDDSVKIGFGAIVVCGFFLFLAICVLFAVF